nr:MAG TPA: hypothetical protein [Caudoviricetes sp.]
MSIRTHGDNGQNVELNRLRFSRFNFKIKRKKETLSEECLVGKIITKVKSCCFYSTHHYKHIPCQQA